MERSEVLAEIKKYFDIEELVCDHVLGVWGNQAWQFFDTAFLETLLILRRDVIQRPMYCNNHSKGVYQRGLRCNMCELVKSKERPYLSAHIFGKGGDFSIEGVSGIKEMDYIRSKIRVLAGGLPYPIRMEAGVSWLHIDVMPTPNGSKVHEFRA